MSRIQRLLRPASVLLMMIDDDDVISRQEVTEQLQQIKDVTGLMVFGLCRCLQTQTFSIREVTSLVHSSCSIMPQPSHCPLSCACEKQLMPPTGHHPVTVQQLHNVE